MTDNELRDRIADILEALDGMDLDQQAQAVINSLGLSTQVCCDECTGVTIEGYYDTAFD